MEHALEDLRQYPGKKHMVEKEIKHMTEHLEEILKHLKELIDYVEHLKEEYTK